MNKVNIAISVTSISCYCFMFQFVIVSCLASLSLGAPSPQQVVGFGDATAQEIAEIRAGTYGEMFDDNPQYNFNYKVKTMKQKSVRLIS